MKSGKSKISVLGMCFGFTFGLFLATSLPFASCYDMPRIAPTTSNGTVGLPDLDIMSDAMPTTLPMSIRGSSKTLLAKRSVTCPDGPGFCDDGWTCLPVSNNPADGDFCLSGCCHYKCPTTRLWQICTGSESCCGTHCVGSTGFCCGSWDDPTSQLCTTGQVCGAGNQCITPTVVQSVDAWSSRGCFTDSINARGLDKSYINYSGMTVEACIAAAAGYQWAGVEYGGECYFGNTLESFNSIAAPIQDCNMPCAGNPSELCGAGNRMNLYQNTAYVIPPEQVPAVGNFKLLGCYTDSINARGLSQMTTDWNHMTARECIVDIAANYKYAGLEYSSECHYGNTLAASSVPTTGCDTPCTGDPGEVCGGSNKITLYLNSAYVPPTV